MSSPLIYPSSPPSPGRLKRPHPADSPSLSHTPAPMETTSGFLLDEDSDSDVSTTGPLPKKRMLHIPSIPGIDDTIPPLTLGAKHDLPVRLGDAEKGIEVREYEEPVFEASLFGERESYVVKNCQGRMSVIRQRVRVPPVPYEELVAGRSRKREGRATRSYYGIQIHQMVQDAKLEMEAARILREQEAEKQKKREEDEAHKRNIDAMLVDSVEAEGEARTSRKPKKHSLWTEKYRARRFLDLCGDDTTNRHVLRWIKSWDPIVFPGSRSVKKNEDEEEQQHKKILLLTGPPGLGKTTLAHVCARQAGYDVLEINASDDRSRDVVRGRIRTSLGTETVKTVTNSKMANGGKPKVARPLCVVVDEVDGVTSGSGAGGDGGFIKALIDLVSLSENNFKESGGTGKGKKKDNFRQMRPLILICNDIYAPALRPLRVSSMAEIVHVGKPTVDHVVNRLLTVFSKEGINCERDAARKLCEAAWGMASGIEARRGVESAIEGDLRGVIVVSQWVATRFQAQSLSEGNKFLSRMWLEKNALKELQDGSGGGRGTGRGSVRDIVTRVFQEGAGFPKPALGDKSETRIFMSELPKANLGFAEHFKRNGMAQLQHMIETSGDTDRIMAEIFAEYPNREYTDDSAMGKPNKAYEWMAFLDTCSSRLFREQEWELAPYLSQPILACHSLFAAPIRQAANNYRRNRPDDEDSESPMPFSGPRGAFQMAEAEKANRAILQSLQDDLPPRLLRAFRSPEDVATEFLPFLCRLISPEVKPVIINQANDTKPTASVRKDSEKKMVKRAAETLANVNVKLLKGRIESDGLRGSQWVYRLEPDLDGVAVYKTLAGGGDSGVATRYAVRQVLDHELQVVLRERETAARQARFAAGGAGEYEFGEEEDAKIGTAEVGTETVQVAVKRDFFGRVITETRVIKKDVWADENKVNVWIRYHEGLNNAVRKPLTVDDFLRGL